MNSFSLLYASKVNTFALLQVIKHSHSFPNITAVFFKGHLSIFQLFCWHLSSGLCNFWTRDTTQLAIMRSSCLTEAHLSTILIFTFEVWGWFRKLLRSSVYFEIWESGFLEPTWPCSLPSVLIVTILINTVLYNEHRIKVICYILYAKH